MQRAEKETRGRKKEEGREGGERLLASGRFSWRNMGITVLIALLSFGVGTSNCLDKLCLAS